MSAARVERQGPRLLLITGLWPTPDAPSAGIFVKRRADQLVSPTVIAPRSYRGSTLIRYLALGVRALTARGRYDGVEVHWLFPTGLIGLIAARLRGVPLVVYAHGDDIMVTPWRSRIFHALAKLAVRMADAVVTNSSESAEYLARLGVQAVVIPPGVDLDRFYPTPRPKDGKVLYLGGRVEGHRKGLDVAAELADTLVGPGLEEVGPDQVPDLIRKHDIVLMPSRREAFGLVAAEAIASGRWVVARSVGGLKEIVQDGVNGFLVDDGDFESALRRVPDYEPSALAATVGRFDAKQEALAMNEVWARCLSRSRQES